MSARDPTQLEYEGILLAESDFQAGKDEGETIQAGNVAEVATAEVNEDGQLASYDAVQVGDRMDATTRSARGKLFVDLRTGNDSDSDGEVDQVDKRTEFRLVTRPKNSNRRTPLTRWYSQRNLDRDDPRQRIPLPPTKNENGKDQLISSGRIIAVEVRNSATSTQVSLSDSDFALPSRGGY